MIVAQVNLSPGRWWFITRKGNHTNDIPSTVEIDGASGTKLTVALADIVTISLVDFELADRLEKGTRDAFPHLWRGKPGC